MASLWQEFFLKKMLSIGEVRVGQSVVFEGQPHLVTSAQHSKQARGAGVLKTVLKNLHTGATIAKTFQGSEKLEPAEVGFFKAQFLFADGEHCHFQREDDFEQFQIAKENLEEQLPFLVEGESFDIQHFQGEPFAVNLPIAMIFTVSETPPGVKGDTASGGSKSATLENGLVVQVPLFVKEGERVKIDTRENKFLQRVQD